MNFRLLTIVLVLGAFGLLVNESRAQQDPQFSMNMATRLQVNPAYAGMNDGICVNLLSRQQWAGFEGRPETYLFGGHGTFTIPGINLRSGGGISMFGDGLGQMHFFGVKAAYSAHIPLNFIGGEPGHLGIGVSAGMLQFSLGNNWRSITPFYDDPTIPNVPYTSGSFDMDAGVYYRTKDVYFGISATHLNGANFQEGGDEFTDQGGLGWNTSFDMARHYYLMGGYDFELPNYNLIVLKPSVMVKTDLSSAQFDLNLIAEWNNFLWGGASYRFTDAATLLGGINYGLPKGNIRVGYAYDITTSRIRTGSNGSHEFFVQYCLKLKTPPPVQKHKTVRFL
ncbi:type IX secretion system membrane protein PorP/SprF [Salibacteraceae bacterium]|mgnify:FL=1|jgi:type IX secretion system PorP/SprF family membrane protein|nr:type IX secretion system membrane protein PorP/SprF [Flavobacteriales bacterium]MDB9701583.1 type IX secretion system membrane protein PorP/SprF [Salibacteraceae bacterium]